MEVRRNGNKEVGTDGGREVWRKGGGVGGSERTTKKD